MWRLLVKIGIPAKLATLHDGMKAAVSVGGEFTDEFQGTIGLRQGCILVPSLFVLLFAFVVRHVPEYPATWRWSERQARHYTDGDLFNLRPLRSELAKTTTVSVAFTHSYETDSLLLTFTSTFRATNSYSFSTTLIDSLKKRKTTIQNITLH